MERNNLTNLNPRQEALKKYVESNDDISLVKAMKRFIWYGRIIFVIFFGMILWYGIIMHNYFKDIWMLLTKTQ